MSKRLVRVKVILSYQTGEERRNSDFTLRWSEDQPAEITTGGGIDGYAAIPSEVTRLVTPIQEAIEKAVAAREATPTAEATE